MLHFNGKALKRVNIDLGKVGVSRVGDTTSVRIEGRGEQIMNGFIEGDELFMNEVGPKELVIKMTDDGYEVYSTNAIFTDDGRLTEADVTMRRFKS